MHRPKHSPDINLHLYLNCVVRHPLISIVLIGIMTLVFAWQLPRLSFKTTVYDLIIEDLPEAGYYQDFKTIFGSDEIIRLVVKADDVFETASFAKVAQISEAAGRIKGVRRILSLPEIKKSVDIGNKWTMVQFEALLAPVTLLERNLISSDHRTTIITLVLSDEADKTIVIAALEDLIADAGPNLSLYQTGMPLVSQALAEYTRKDFFQLTPFTLLVIAAALVVLFRNLQCVLLPLSCVALTIIWTFGLMAWAGIALSMLTIIVPVFLIAVGTAYCLHICSDYLAQARNNPSNAPGVQATLRRVALPVTLAVVTTIIAISSLVVNHIVAIREFAFFTCFGMFSLLIIALTLIPAVLTIAPLSSEKTLHPFGFDRWIDGLLHRVVTLNLRYQRPVFIIFGAITVICLAGIFFIQVETNPVSFFKRNTPVSRHFHDIYSDMSGSFPMNVTVAAASDDYFEDPDHLVEVVRLQEYLDQLPGVDKTLSLVDYLKLVNYVVNDYNAQFHVLPQDPYEMRYLLNHFKMLLGSDLLQRFLSPDYRQLNILMLTHIASSRSFLATREAALKQAGVLLDPSLRVDVTGLGIVIAASSHLLTSGQIKSLSISLVLIFTIMAILFLSTRVGLIALLPNIFPILVNFGIMGLLGIPLSVATSLIASIVIGLAVDDTIHYMVRYNAEFKKDLDKDRAMRDTVFHTGRPILFSSFTIGLGFAVLILSHFQPTAIFGFLMVVTMAAALLGDLILLPILMMHVELVTAWDMLKSIPLVGRISSGMVHELNQPLNAIKVGSDFLKMMAKRGASVSPQQLAVVSQEIGDQVARASDIIHRFSEVALLSERDRGPLQINVPINEALGLLGNQIRLDNIEVEVDLAESLPLIAASHSHMVQVFCHLIQNAWEAIVEKKKYDAGGVAHRIAIQALQTQGQMRVMVTDTGRGIPGHYLDRVFEPFFTTKAEGEGKGLGLTVVQQIVRDMGARIAIDSQPGRGTTVTLTFPILSPSPDQDQTCVNR